MTRLIGLGCKRCKALSLQVLIGRGLDPHACSYPQPPVQLSGCSPTNVLGGHSGGDPPVPIPNTAVKPSSAHGTAGATLWESRSPPRHFCAGAPLAGGGHWHLSPTARTRFWQQAAG